MKKFTVLFLAGLLILAFGATSYAQAPKLEFKASGFIDAQYVWLMNVPQYNTNSTLYATPPSQWAVPAGGVAGYVAGVGKGGVGWNKQDNHWESRGHLKFDAIMGPNLSGTFYFEIDSLRYGSNYGAGGSGFAGTVNGREANNFGAWTTDRTAIEVKNVYIDVGLPYFGLPVPITVRVGAQPIGVRPAMLVYSDGAGVTAGIKIDPVLINPIYAKAVMNSDYQAADSDVWGLQASAKISTFTLGGYGLNYRMNSYPFNVPAPVAGLPANLTPYVPGSYQSKMWWVGAYADGRAGPVDLNFDFVYDFGKVERNRLDIQNHSFERSVAYRGWAVRGKVDYPMEKFNFGGVGMFATGGNAHRSSTSGLPGSKTSIGLLSTRYDGYVVPPGSEQGPGNQESIVMYSVEPGATGGYGIADRANYQNLSPGGFGGTWFAKLYASMKATPWWKITFQALYIGDTTKNANTFGTAWKFPNNLVDNHTLRDNHDIGYEFDLIHEFQIYNNLRFYAGFGYLFAGDALDVGEITKQGFPINRTPKDPWALRTRLMYTF